METRLLDQLEGAARSLNMKSPLDCRGMLATNPNAKKKWRKRDPEALQGLVWHQELGWGSIEAVAKYHTGKNSHLLEGGVESIAYSLAIRRNGQIVLCNDLKKTTWSQGYKGRTGDENAEFLSVMFEGMFRGHEVTDSKAGEPNDRQMLSGLILWQVCRSLWNWKEGALYGHFLFGKPSCPGTSLQTVIDAVRTHAPKPKMKFDTSKKRQQALKKLGYNPGSIDGKWGPRSRGALVRFQEDHGLAADGVWGPRTEAAISAALENK